MMFALVSSGCHNKTPWTEWLTQWELVFSLISGAWEVQNQSACRFSIWWVPSSWLVVNHLLAMSLHNGGGGMKEMGWGVRENSEGTLMCVSLFERTLILSDQSLTIIVFFNPGYLQKGPTPNTVTLQEHQNINFGGNADIQLRQCFFKHQKHRGRR